MVAGAKGVVMHSKIDHLSWGRESTIHTPYKMLPPQATCFYLKGILLQHTAHGQTLKPLYSFECKSPWFNPGFQHVFFSLVFSLYSLLSGQFAYIDLFIKKICQEKYRPVYILLSVHII